MKKIKIQKQHRQQKHVNKPVRDSEIVISRNGTKYQVAPSGSWHRITSKLNKKQIRKREREQLTRLLELRRRFGIDENNNSNSEGYERNKEVE